MSDFIDRQLGTGDWRGTSRLHDPMTGLLEDSASLLNIQNADADPKAEGAAVTQINYTWAYQNAPQTGTLLLYATAENTRADWTDTWHTGGEVMPLVAEARSETTLSLIGRYAAPPGPDWGWRIVIESGDETLRLHMDNIAPDGEEMAAVEAEYQQG